MSQVHVRCVNVLVYVLPARAAVWQWLYNMNREMKPRFLNSTARLRLHFTLTEKGEKLLDFDYHNSSLWIYYKKGIWADYFYQFD